MPSVKFETDSGAEPLLIVTTAGANTVLSLTPGGAQKRSASMNIPANTPTLLTWVFGGGPGTKYEIALEPRAKITLSRGSNPIKSSISTSRLFGQGSVMLQVAP